MLHVHALAELRTIRGRMRDSGSVTIAGNVYMSRFVISTVLLCAALGCTVGAALIYFAMIAAVNARMSKLSQVSYLTRDLGTLFRLHRTLYPDSALRILQVACVSLATILALLFVMAL